MPSPQAILAGLAAAARGAIAVAIAWHLVAFAASAALLSGWKPSRRAAGALLTLPIASAAIVAFSFHNPFNGIVLGAVAVALATIAGRFAPTRIPSSSRRMRLVGGLVVGFGLVYPHFLDSLPAAAYFVAAPAGVVPCPTLSLAIGVSLLGGGLGSKAWSTVLGAAGLFYGLFGVVRLGVVLDIGLVAGALALLAMAVGMRARGIGLRPLSATSNAP